MFDESSPDYDLEAAKDADQLLKESLIFDENGRLVGSKLSPYQLYKSIALPAQRMAAKAKTVGQAAAQKATEKMLANVDSPGGSQQGEVPFEKLSLEKKRAWLKKHGHDV
jgi:hypothetical protein